MEIIKLNLIPNGVNPTCHCSQYDNGRTIRVDLFNGLTPYVLQSGDTVTLNVRKPDNTIVVTSLTATQGNTYVNIETTEQMCACVGFNLCDLTIENGSKKIGTLNFIMQVERDVLADGIPSQSRIDDLDELVQEAVGDNYYTKSEVYNKTEIDAALADKASEDELNELKDIIYSEENIIDDTDSGSYQSDPETVSFAHPYNFVAGRKYKAILKVNNADFLSATDAIRIQQSTSTGTSTTGIIASSYVFRLNNTAANPLHDNDTFETEFVAKEGCVNLLARYKFSTGDPSVDLDVFSIETVIDNINDINNNIEKLTQNCRMKMGAHRGAESFAPPNCVAAYEIAGKMGFDWAWLAQIRYSADNTLYVMHDEDVSITTNGTGNMSELSDTYINSLLCNKISGYDYSQFTDDDLRVPTLEKAIQICLRYGMKMCFRIEPLPNSMDTERAVTIWTNFFNLIKAYGITPDEATYSGYNPNEMRLCLDNLGDVEICPYISGYSAQDYIDWFEERPDLSNVKKAVLKAATTLTLSDIKLLHSNGIKVYAFTNSSAPTQELMENLATWGVDILQNPKYAKIPIV